MDMPERRGIGLLFPELMEWLEQAMVGLRPFVQILRIGERVEARCVLRAEVGEIDFGQDVEIVVDDGVLRIRVERTRNTEPCRSSIAYWSVTLPATADIDDVRTNYRDGVLEIGVGLTEANKARDPGSRRCPAPVRADVESLPELEAHGGGR
ncbi:Hsp20 family protein [Nonomuraea phyllanthi]|uniref:Hsp20/alpha crystallin family protein n=1 Tax=Nonomuraea phyllanthi TaxID=2219224 RepID=UPI0012938134|nr:Hsp20 family protein [Nonomuraea phyllanthi]QFY07973.1 Hsp20 family protein [Nonomuraea phyllanthi]